jgi:hypothetical protein
MLHTKKFAAAAKRRNAVPTLLAIELASADAAAARTIRRGGSPDSGGTRLIGPHARR